MEQSEYRRFARQSKKRSLAATTRVATAGVSRHGRDGQIEVTAMQVDRDDGDPGMIETWIISRLRSRD